MLYGEVFKLIQVFQMTVSFCEFLLPPPHSHSLLPAASFFP